MNHVRMWRLRIIATVLLLFAWAPATNACLLATAFPNVFAGSCEEMGCCDGEGAGEVGCNECSILEDGVCVSHLQAFSVESPILQEDGWLTGILLVLMRPVAEKAPPGIQDSSPPEPPLWHFVARTALPVRGPSLA